MENIFNWLYNIMYQNDVLAVFAAFGWGILSVILSPCHLAALPLILAYIANKNNNVSSLKLSFLFALGILITIIIIGLITSELGRIMGDLGGWANLITGTFLVGAGLFFLDFFTIGRFGINTEKLNVNSGSLSLILGLTAGLALGPCTFAFMAPVFAYGFRVSQTKPFTGFSLFISYGLGHSLVILTAGLLTSKIQSYLTWAGSANSVIIFKKVCGVLVIIGGIYIFYIGLL